MFPRLARYCRPLAFRTYRNFCSKGPTPAFHMRYPWRQVRQFDDFFPRGSPMRNWIRVKEKEFDEFIGHFARNSELGSSRSGGIQVTYNKSLFEVKLDVAEFKPEEIEMKLTDSRLLVRGKHEQKADDHGFVQRGFKREFEVPEDVNLESMKSTISEDGVLTIRANVKVAEKPPDKEIEIKRENSS